MLRVNVRDAPAKYFTGVRVRGDAHAAPDADVRQFFLVNLPDHPDRGEVCDAHDLLVRLDDFARIRHAADDRAGDGAGRLTSELICEEVRSVPTR